jgi:hypothetical protein
MCLTMSFQRSEFIRDVVGFVGRQGAGEIQKKIVSPSNIVDKGGRTLLRCRRGGQGHGGMRSKLLGWVKAGQRPMDSFIESVPA